MFSVISQRTRSAVQDPNRRSFGQQTNKPTTSNPEKKGEAHIRTVISLRSGLEAVRAVVVLWSSWALPAAVIGTPTDSKDPLSESSESSSLSPTSTP